MQLIHRAACWFGQAEEALNFWAIGTNQSPSGLANNLALINFHLASGTLGRTGRGPFSLTGHPHAMGGREVGYMSGLLPRHRDVSNLDHRDQIARIWAVPPKRIQPQPGLDALGQCEAIEAGDVKALWDMGCTPLA